MKKLFTAEEIKSASTAQNAKDTFRTLQVKETLKAATTQLDDVEARFDIALSKQRVFWAKEEEKALAVLGSIQDEIKQKTALRDSLLIPIEAREKKAHALFQEAESAFALAQSKMREAEKIKAEAEELQELLTTKIDELSTREHDIRDREIKSHLERETLDAERESIKSLSAELTNKLTSLHGSNRLGIPA